MRRSKLTPEQEGEVYRQAREGARYSDIQAWLARQGVTLAKSSISELRRRVERRALAQQPAEPQDEYIDPRTGARVALTDDMELSYILRLMMFHAFGPGFPPSCRRSAVKLALQVMATRRKFRAESAAQRR